MIPQRLRPIRPLRVAAPWLVALFTVGILLQGNRVMAQLPTQRVKAPAFPEGFAWLNTDRPLRWGAELEGRIVVLDFWTYCCINCIHMLPVLHEIEQRYAGQPVTVIGVHSNKFENEGEAANVRSAVLRYRVEHPVVVDQGHRIWSEFGVRAWPTLMFVDAEGRVVGAMPGENSAEAIASVIDQLLAEGRERGTLTDQPLELRPEQSVPSASGLAFPGKVLADAAGGRLFIADSNHHRIVEATLQGEVRAIYGSGEPGLRDGSAAQAQFDNPQGMALDAEAGLLFVADTDNHALREIDLATGAVRTLAGTGEQSHDRAGGGLGVEQGLNSPWALELDGDRILIAMAGPHQLWVHDRASGRTANWVGSGRESIIDGPAEGAALAQPSAMARLGDVVYFADSEVSAVRGVDLGSNTVHTLIGTGLFDFGDRDGPFERALLQHPIGLAAGEGALFVADTYNHKVKRLDLDEKQITTVLGEGSPAELDLYEPGGLSVSGGRLYVADTNHHRIAVMDLASGEAHELALFGWPGAWAAEEDETRQIAPARLDGLAAGRALSLGLMLDWPTGWKHNPAAPVTLSVRPVSGNGSGLIDTPSGRFQQTLPPGTTELDFTLPLADEPGEASWLITATLGLCTEADRGLCRPARADWRVEATTTRGGEAAARLSGTVR